MRNDFDEPRIGQFWGSIGTNDDVFGSVTCIMLMIEAVTLHSPLDHNFAANRTSRLEITIKHR